MVERLFRRDAAARYVTETYGYPCAATTLAKLACVSRDGPPFYKVGRWPMYPRSGLDEWVAGRLGPLVRNNSELEQSWVCEHCRRPAVAGHVCIRRERLSLVGSEGE
jgi:hypothetical protein